MNFSTGTRKKRITILLFILLSLGVLSACNENVQPDRQVGQASSNQRGKVLRLEHKQTHPNQRVNAIKLSFFVGWVERIETHQLVETKILRKFLTMVGFALALPTLQKILNLMALNQRVALVIGNGAYYKNPLPNPPNDSDDMVTVLKQVGFEVMLLKDASLQKMKEAIQAFGEKLKKGGVGLFYFAGHGVQYQGKNYLFPISAMQSVNVAELLPYETLDVGYLLATMEGAKNNLNVVILDACRNNPFARSLFIGRGVKSQNGLAMMEVPSGTLIAYATRPNKTALDGTAGGRNSPYVKYLKRELPKPGLSIVEV